MATVPVSNTSAQLNGGELLLADNAPQTVTKTITFDNGASAPFAVSAGSAMVDHLDAEMVGGETTASLHDAAALTGLVPPPALSTVAALADGATPALDASLGNLFTLIAAGNREIAIPTNPTPGQKIIIAHTASAADRTLTLNTGAGGFRYGTDITGLTPTTSGKTDYIGCIYNAAASFWDVVAYSKGY